MKETESSLHDDKALAFYSAAISAWLETRFELDRQLLTLSAAGIGLLITLLTTVGPAGCIQIAAYAAALGSFAACAGTVLVVLALNSSHLEKLVADESGIPQRLACLDRVARIAFVLGVAATTGIGVTQLFAGAERRDEMSERQLTEKVLREQADSRKSVGGFEALKPKPAAPPAESQGGSAGQGSPSKEPNKGK